MSPTMAITLMIVGWLFSAACLLWGMLRIARRHHRPVARVTPANAKPRQVAGVH